MKPALVITRADDRGGAQVHVRDLALALQERGMEVSVLAGADGFLFEELAGSGVRCRRLARLVHPVRPAGDWAAYRELRAALGELQPDLVATHSNKAGLLGRLAARSLQIPAVHTSHGFLFGERPHSPAGLFYRLAEKAAARLGERVIVVSRSEFETALSLGVVPEKKLALIHNGLPDLGRQKLAAPETSPPRLVMVARFARPKDHLTLLRALAGLKGKPWTLCLVGDGRGRPRAEALAAELGIAGRVEFAGVREDVPALLAESQVFVLSSRREGFPLSILEAMRAGLPVVASKVGGTAEAVADSETGYLFPRGEVLALREALGSLLDRPVLRREMGLAGRARYQRLFTLERMVEQTTALYESIAAAPPR